MILLSASARQPPRRTWSREELIHGCNIALGLATNLSSRNTYESHLNSYVAFCTKHGFPFNPTPDTLSFFVIYMSHHIELHSVGSYLSGICDQLEIYYPDACRNRESQLIKKMLAGMKKLCSKPIRHKQPITRTHLLTVVNSLSPSSSYDSILFAAMLVTGTCSLLRLGELTVPDNPVLRNFRKVVGRDSVEVDKSSFSFWLPFHKANRLFEGNHVVIPSSWGINSRSIFRRYLHLRNGSFPFHPHLWVTPQGSVPTRDWFMRRLC
ncbi:hypothetical protein GYMLUDRAFT_1026035 [Collybiopsis luxurians FD-317 M1]|nr:hypothetical protein GYMLUDRAFT_1026035 [Collybiopsis luxurians FD-317 M1]